MMGVVHHGSPWLWSRHNLWLHFRKASGICNLTAFGGFYLWRSPNNSNHQDSSASSSIMHRVASHHSLLSATYRPWPHNHPSVPGRRPPSLSFSTRNASSKRSTTAGPEFSSLVGGSLPEEGLPVFESITYASAYSPLQYITVHYILSHSHTCQTLHYIT